MTDHQITGPLRLRLKLHAGSISVTTTDEPRAHVEVQPLRDDDGCRRRASEVQPELRPRGDGQELLVEATGKGGLFGWRDDCPLAITIRAPHGCSIDCETASASIDGTGRFGGVSIRSASGDVRLGDVDGEASIKSASGTIELGSVSGQAKISGVSGDVRIASAAGDVTATLVSGDLRVGPLGAGITAKSVSGDIELERVARGTVECRSVSGDVTIGIARGASVYMDVKSLSGDTISDLEPADAPAGGERVAVEITAKSTSGDIRLRTAADRATV